MSTIHYLGRFDFSTPGEAAYEWSGSGFDAHFQGTGIAAKFTTEASTGYLEVVIDDGTPKLVTYAGGTDVTVSLASGLTAGTHHVQLFRRTEADMGIERFLGFTVTGGALVASPPPYSRKIEFIGDSITAGYGDEGANRNCKFSYGTENDYLTYGALTARALSAERHSNAWSGIGMYRDNAGITKDQMPVLYERTLPSEPGSQWNFSQWIPDVVVINLGTNDYAKSDDPSQPYTTAYLAFLEKLRSHYPRAEVFCAMGPLWVKDLSQWQDALEAIVKARNDRGDNRVHFVSFDLEDCDTDISKCGCDWHPNLEEHQKMADALVPAIRAVTGW